MKFVDNAGQAWRWFSMWAMGVPASVMAVWLLMPEKLQDLVLVQIPPKQLAWGLVVVLGLGILGRLVNQTKPEAKE